MISQCQTIIRPVWRHNGYKLISRPTRLSWPIPRWSASWEDVAAWGFSSLPSSPLSTSQSSVRYLQHQLWFKCCQIFKALLEAYLISKLASFSSSVKTYTCHGMIIRVDICKCGKALIKIVSIKIRETYILCLWIFVFHRQCFTSILNFNEWELKYRLQQSKSSFVTIYLNHTHWPISTFPMKASIFF